MRSLTCRFLLGVATGQAVARLRVRRGGLSRRGVRNLIVTVQVSDNVRFQRGGDDLYTDVTVSMVQAALGLLGPVDGILPDEKIEVKVPAGTQYGTAIPVEGYGMPRMGRSGRGRLVARVLVHIPEHLSSEARQALERYEDAVGEDYEKQHKTVGDRNSRRHR